MRLLIIALVVGCASRAAPPISSKQPPSGPANATRRPATPGDPPPAGVALPRVGTATIMRKGDSPTLWDGVFEVDPADPEVARLVRESPATKDRAARTPGEAGCRLYSEAAERAGAAVEWSGDSPDIRLGTVEVICETGPNSRVPGDNMFELVAMSPGAG